jgi:hypothetical protein
VIARLLASGALAVTLAFGASTAQASPVPMWGCVYEDSAGPCFWDAKHQGNGRGRSFWVDRKQHVHHSKWVDRQQRHGWPFFIGLGYDARHPKAPCVARYHAATDTSDVKCRGSKHRKPYIERGI